MSDMQDGAIITILQKAVASAVAASSVSTIPIKYVARTFTPPSDQKYFEIVIIPNNRSGDYWGDEKNYRGMMRLILHWPNDDTGITAPMAALKSVADYFSKGTLLQNVQIYDNPDFQAMLEQGSENLYPVSIRYQSFR